MPKHDQPTGRGRLRICTMDTAMGARLFVWDTDGNNLGTMTWAKAFASGILGAGRFDAPLI